MIIRRLAPPAAPAAAAALALAAAGFAPPAAPTRPLVSTFSIVAVDPDNGDLGVAVQSKFPNVRAVVPWARAGVGAVATQSFARLNYATEGLELMARGATNREIGATLHLSPHTVKEHTSGVYRKLGVRNRTQAVLRAHTLGLLG